MSSEFSSMSKVMRKIITLLTKREIELNGSYFNAALLPQVISDLTRLKYDQEDINIEVNIEPEKITIVLTPSEASRYGKYALNELYQMHIEEELKKS